jgi:hypothetical protein
VLERSTIRFQFWHFLLTIVLLTSLAAAAISAAGGVSFTAASAPPALVSEVNSEPQTGGPLVEPSGISEVNTQPLTGAAPDPGGSSAPSDDAAPPQPESAP